ncbi:transcriptional adapter, putative [Entamoeba invadens IP1]|uniref:Transcriptional adapter, putative n=1 Tax=Entamoeba invadens IP1 TaxID=370355 RepID=A0A0A1U7V7_ENTIV|nr:transcriptional adapter, putative [Entamoeba invadens IP1]ELP90875.1 transcriptional adapter, putative [Entamoeba invadens IP1]|eukprot:XP_004257646.1 transcriptional adapter, putative [Entamoeba invadens IP1]
MFCPWENITCNCCNKTITSTTRITCTICDNFDLCLECFSQGKEVGRHKNDHGYTVVPTLHFPLLTPDWGADEELMLLEAIEEKGLDNWVEVQNFVKTKAARECRSHYLQYYLETPTHPLPDMTDAFLVKNGIVEMKPAKEVRLKDEEFDARPEKEIAYSQPVYDGFEAQFNPYRKEFGFEFFNNAELSITDVSFGPDDTQESREATFKRLEQYYKMYIERIRVRNLAIENELVDPKKLRVADRKRTKEEKEVFENYRHFLPVLGKDDLEKYIKASVEEGKLIGKLRKLRQKRREGCLTMEETKERRRSTTKIFESETKAAMKKPMKRPHA